jgi:GH25 family lysozyme M1 (1,4-beta-N-acetylmuramidase)
MDQPISGLVLGEDLSYYEGQWNVVTALANGVSFMSTRACVGNNPDSEFGWDWSAAKGKMIRNAYGLFDSAYAPKPQADLLASIVKGDIGEIPPCIDLEPNGGLTDVQWQKQPYYGWNSVYNYASEVMSALGINRLTLYTNLRGLNILPAVGTPQAQWFIDHFDLWISQQPYTPTPRTGFFPTWKWMQYSFNGPGPQLGTQTLGVDINTYNGTLQQMQAEFPLAGQASVVTPPAATTVPMWTIQSQMDAQIVLAKQS